MIKIKIKNDFNLQDTVTCGQIFRFYLMDDNSYDIVLSDRVINVKVNDNYLIVKSNNYENLEEVVTNYFDLDNDYKYINDKLIENDIKIKNAVDFSKGLKMIRQEPFETIIEYIISANNGVNQIANAMDLIAKNYGKKIIFEGKEYFLFPKYNELKEITEEQFRNCKVGFRDKYIKNIIDKLNNNEISLSSFYDMDTTSSLNKLMENKGIGPKVASCILLFAYQKYDVFPVDTWVKKVMKNNYGIVGEANIRDFAKKTYGKYSALAIQYMFHYGRNKK